MAEPVISSSRPSSSLRKAEQLLMSKLTVAQRRDFPNGWFEVTGSLGGTYRIWTHSTVQNISQDVPGYTRAVFCVTPRRAQPRWDMLLSQKLLIEADEGLFLRTAYKTGGYAITTVRYNSPGRSSYGYFEVEYVD